MYEVLDDYVGKEEGLTYKKLCEILDLKYYKGGTSKMAQIKDIERYYKMEKVKTKYKIIEKRKSPIEKTDNRHDGGNTKYGDDIETILLYKLQTETSNVFECTISQALLLCNLINENYNVGRKNIPLTSKVLELDEKIIYGFYDNTSKKLKDTFERALNKMRSKALISYEKRTKVAYKHVCIEENECGLPLLDENDMLSYKIEDIHRYASESERRLIIECEAYALNSLECKSKQEVFLSHLWNDYMKILNGRLLKLSNIKYYYEVYNIVINHEQVNKFIKYIEQEEAKKNLNSKIVTSLEKSIEKKDKEVVFRDSGTQKKLDKLIGGTKKMIHIAIEEKPTTILKDEIEEYNNKISQDKKKESKNTDDK